MRLSHDAAVKMIECIDTGMSGKTRMSYDDFLAFVRKDKANLRREQTRKELRLAEKNAMLRHMSQGRTHRKLQLARDRCTKEEDAKEAKQIIATYLEDVDEVKKQHEVMKEKSRARSIRKQAKKRARHLKDAGLVEEETVGRIRAFLDWMLLPDSDEKLKLKTVCPWFASDASKSSKSQEKGRKEKRKKATPSRVAQALLEQACVTGVIPELVHALIVKGGADLNKTNDRGAAALHHAVWWGRTDLVELMVEGVELADGSGQHSADVVVTNKSKNTPLHFAYAQRRPELVAYLLDRGGGACAAMKNADGKTPAELKPKDAEDAALERSETEAKIEAFLAGLPEGGVANSRGGNAVDAFLNNKSKDAGPGADIHKQAQTLLEQACITGLSKRLFQALVNKGGADVNEPNHRGAVALHHAVWWGQSELVEMMVTGEGLDNGQKAIVTTQNSSMNTALHFAYKQRRAEIISFLLTHGGAPCQEMANNDGKRPIDMKPMDMYDRYREIHRTGDAAAAQASATDADAGASGENKAETVIVVASSDSKHGDQARGGDGEGAKPSLKDVDAWEGGDGGDVVSTVTPAVGANSRGGRSARKERHAALGRKRNGGGGGTANAGQADADVPKTQRGTARDQSSFARQFTLPTLSYAKKDKEEEIVALDIESTVSRCPALPRVVQVLQLGFRRNYGKRMGGRLHIVRVDGLIVRTGPGTDFESVKKLRRFQSIYITTEKSTDSGIWARIVAPLAEQWVLRCTNSGVSSLRASCMIEESISTTVISRLDAQGRDVKHKLDPAAQALREQREQEREVWTACRVNAIWGIVICGFLGVMGTGTFGLLSSWSHASGKLDFGLIGMAITCELCTLFAATYAVGDKAVRQNCNVLFSFACCSTIGLSLFSSMCVSVAKLGSSEDNGYEPDDSDATEMNWRTAFWSVSLAPSAVGLFAFWVCCCAFSCAICFRDICTGYGDGDMDYDDDEDFDEGVGAGGEGGSGRRASTVAKKLLLKKRPSRQRSRGTNLKALYSRGVSGRRSKRRGKGAQMSLGRLGFSV
jgi:ankyrin repeat protein